MKIEEPDWNGLRQKALPVNSDLPSVAHASESITTTLTATIK
jgi:hypothetical protein